MTMQLALNLETDAIPLKRGHVKRICACCNVVVYVKPDELICQKCGYKSLAQVCIAKVCKECGVRVLVDEESLDCYQCNQENSLTANLECCSVVTAPVETAVRKQIELFSVTKQFGFKTKDSLQKDLLREYAKFKEGKSSREVSEFL
jgi:hypothetical protein